MSKLSDSIEGIMADFDKTPPEHLRGLFKTTALKFSQVKLLAAAQDKANMKLKKELGAALAQSERTVRNQEIEIDRLKRRLAELESRP